MFTTKEKILIQFFNNKSFIFQTHANNAVFFKHSFAVKPLEIGCYQLK